MDAEATPAQPTKSFTRSVIKEFRRSAMSSELIPQPAARIRKARVKQAATPTKFEAPDRADPQAALDEQATQVRASKFTLGQNVGLALVQAEQAGFAEGLQAALTEGAADTASFFSNCISAAGQSLL
jgi:flagellar biosynthesis/type III secretory pathway protein FliH